MSVDSKCHSVVLIISNRRLGSGDCKGTVNLNVLRPALADY